LSDSPADQPKDDSERKTWLEQVKEALKVLGATPRAFALVWKAHPFFTIALILLNVFFGLFPVAQAFVTKLLVDSIIGAVSAKQAASPWVAHLPFGLNILLSVKVAGILFLLGLMGAAELLSGLMQPALAYVSQELTDLLGRDINTLILRKANSFVDITMFETPKFYDLLQSAQREGGYRPTNMIRESGQVGRHAIGLISMMFVLASFNPLLVVVVLIISVPHLVTSFKSQRESWELKSWESAEVRKMHYYNSCLTNKYLAKEVRLFGLGDFFLNRYLQKFAEHRKRRHDVSVKHWWRDTILSVLSVVGQICAYAYIAACALLGTISLGSLTLFTNALDSIQRYVYGLIYSVAGIYQNNLFISHLYEFLELPETMQQAPYAVARANSQSIRKGIEFRNVSFKYEGGDRNVLSDICFKLEPGKSVALVGENGAGKTTVVKLLSRLYDPSAGEIIIDGINLRDYSLSDWRSHIGVIFQDYAHYHLSAQENIGLGQVSHLEDYGMVKVAAERGGAAPVIEKLPNGYDTILGGWFGDAKKDKSTELSGGEWQKVALSRAFMRSRHGSAKDLTGKKDWDEVINSQFREAELLILDEPTASLDAKSEHDVYQRFKELTAGKITLLISHRFSTVRMADTILVLENGAIIEQGSHDSLMELNGPYARLYTLQAEHYK
jgi:ATP-binding cassette, subfamily B, bacterial